MLMSEWTLTFIQPEMLPGAVGDEIATPAMRQLVSDNINILPILNLKYLSSGPYR